jgi:hypothetical protein
MKEKFYSIAQKFFLDLYYRMTKFLGEFPKRLWGQKNFNAYSGLPIRRHNYLKMLEFAPHLVHYSFYLGKGKYKWSCGDASC